jgi:hypothetical protein
MARISLLRQTRFSFGSKASLQKAVVWDKWLAAYETGFQTSLQPDEKI